MWFMKLIHICSIIKKAVKTLMSNYRLFCYGFYLSKILDRDHWLWLTHIMYGYSLKMGNKLLKWFLTKNKSSVPKPQKTRHITETRWETDDGKKRAKRELCKQWCIVRNNFDGRQLLSFKSDIHSKTTCALASPFKKTDCLNWCMWTNCSQSKRHSGFWPTAKQ